MPPARTHFCEEAARGEVFAQLSGLMGADAAAAVEVPDSLYEALFARLRTSTDALRVVEAAAGAASVLIAGPLVHLVARLPLA